MIKWHHYPISLKYNSATPRKAICIQLMLPHIKPAQYYFMPHITPTVLSFYYDDDEERNNRFNYPISKREINFNTSSPLIKEAAWSPGRAGQMGVFRWLL